MSYLANQLITIANKKVVLLLDSYTPKNRKDLNILDASQSFSFSIQYAELQNIRKLHPKTNVYGFWQLLFLSKQISLERDAGFFVVFKNNSKQDGFFLYYNRAKSEFTSGLVINKKAIGAFAQNVDDATIVTPDLSRIELPDAILLPVEKQALTQKLYQTAALQNTLVIGVIALTFFAFYELFFDAPAQQRDLKKQLSNQQTRLNVYSQELTQLKQTRTKVVMASKPPALLEPLFILATLETTGVEFEQPLKSQELTLTFEKLVPWMAMVPTTVLARSEDKNKKVTLHWKK